MECVKGDNNCSLYSYDVNSVNCLIIINNKRFRV